VIPFILWFDFIGIKSVNIENAVMLYPNRVEFYHNILLNFKGKKFKTEKKSKIQRGCLSINIMNHFNSRNNRQNIAYSLPW